MFFRSRSLVWWLMSLLLSGKHSTFILMRRILPNYMSVLQSYCLPPECTSWIGYHAQSEKGRLLLIGALIVTHGNLAHELLNAARQIEADVTGIVAVPLEWGDTVDQAYEKIAGGLERTGHDGRNVRPVIMFNEMFG